VAWGELHEGIAGADLVILHCDEVAMRDRTAASFDVVDRDTQGACWVRDLGHDTGALRAS